MTKETKICPFCGGEILAVAKKCKHCKQFLTEENTSSNSNDIPKENMLNNFNNKKIIVIISAVLILLAICFMFSSPSIVLKGCNLEKSSYPNNGNIRMDYYICKNTPYTSLEIFTDSSGNNPHIGHNVYKKYLDGEYYDNIQIAQRIRNEGEYECDSYIIDEKIRPCSMAQFQELAIKGGEGLESYKAMSKANQKFSSTLQDIKEIRRKYQDEKKYEIHEQNGYSRDYRSIPNPPLPSTLDELMQAFNYYEKIQQIDYLETKGPKKNLEPHFVFNGLEAKNTRNGNIIVFSEDLQYLTVYDSENPKYYMTVKMNFENTSYESVDKIIPANHYIKNSNSPIKIEEKMLEWNQALN